MHPPPIKFCPKCGKPVDRSSIMPQCRPCHALWEKMELRTNGPSWKCAEIGCAQRNSIEDSDAGPRYCAYCGKPRKKGAPRKPKPPPPGTEIPGPLEGEPGP